MVLSSFMDPEDEDVQRARAAVARADADVDYWMQKYKESVDEVHAWAAAAPDEAEDAPRYRLLRETLQDTRSGLDFSVRCASDARQELVSARQFRLSMPSTRTAATGAAEETDFCAAPTALPALGTDGAVHFRIRTSAKTPLPSIQQTLVAMSTSDSGDVRRRETSPVSGRAEDGALAASPRSVTGVQGSSVKRRREIEYLVPPRRTTYLKTFEWPDKTMHHFPKDFTIPVCSLANMWTYWLCGDERAGFPPFRILTAPELEESRTKRALSSLRFVMIEIESRIIRKGAWVNNPSTQEAADMLDTVKESISARPPAKRGELQPVEQLQWTSMGRILRDQKKTTGEEVDEEYRQRR